jgi:hypothetical protein
MLKKWLLYSLLSGICACGSGPGKPQRTSDTWMPGLPAGDEIAYEEAIHEMPDIVLWYEQLPEEVAPGYSLKEREGGWVTLAVNGMPLKAVVDKQKGFLEIQDEEGGEGSRHFQARLYFASNGSWLMAVSEKIHDGVTAKCRNHFYWMDGKRLVPAGSDVLSGFSVFQFYPEDYAEEESMVLLATPFFLDLSSSEKGLVARLITENRHYYCEKAGEKMADQICPIYQRIQKKELNLIWRPEKGFFSAE